MATPPTHEQSPTGTASSGDARRDQPRGSDRLAASRRPVQRRIVIQVLILTGIALIMLVLLGVEVARGTIGLAGAAVGLLAGGTVGVVASRIKRFEWDDQTQRVVSRLDWIGVAILALFIALTIARDWVLGHWAEGAMLAALGLSVTAGVMAGRALGTRRGVRTVLRTDGDVETSQGG